MPCGNLKISYAGASEIGILHEQNEDSWCVATPIDFCLVADGIGCLPDGAIASQTIAEILPQLIGHDLEESGRNGNPKQLVRHVKAAIRKINRIVYDKSDAIIGYRGMGSTLVSCLITGSTAIIAHLGDSRAYLIRKKEIRLLTLDHTVARDLIRQGEIQEKEADEIVHGEALTRYVGMPQDIDAEVSCLRLRPGDLLLLCSDGLTKGLSDREIRAIIGNHGNLDACCHELIDAAVDAGSLDDITVILAKVDDPW